MESDERSAVRIRLWSLREDVLVEGDPEQDQLVVVTRWGETRVDEPGELVIESLRRMSLGPISLGNVLPPEHSSGGRTGRARLGRVLDGLAHSVVHSLGLDDAEGPLLSAVPVDRNATFQLPDLDPARPVRLSRFAAFRAHQGELQVESPLAKYQVVLHRELASRVAAALCQAVPVSELALSLRLAQPVVTDVVAYLVAAGIVQLGEHRGEHGGPWFAEDDDQNLIRWSHHDLLFHSRSRMSRHGDPTGAVFPHAGTLPSPPLVRPAPDGPRYPLFTPDVAELAAADMPLTQVIESAGLCEDLSDRPVTAAQVGELLYRAARIRSVSPAAAVADVTYPISDRPYLSIHGLHELEIYLGLHNCSGLPRGIFHYDPQDHALTMINDSQAELDEVLDMACIATGTTRRPPVLVTITARVARSSWMYPGIAYSLALTHVGALQQMLSLAATAMGLVGCVPAVDAGDVTDSALRLDWPAEVGVGEFIVGYRRVMPSLLDVSP